MQASSSTNDILRDRTKRLFQYVAEVHAARNPIETKITKWSMDIGSLPDISSIEMSPPSVEEEADESRTLLRCARPNPTLPPDVPPALREWLGNEWLDCTESDPIPMRSRNVVTEDGSTLVERFEDDETRVATLDDFTILWNTWAINERLTLAALKVFEHLYSLYGQLERERENIELVVACGSLVLKRAEKHIDYPLLFKPVALQFSAEIPEFHIVEIPASTEFNTPIMKEIDGADLSMLGKLIKDADIDNLHPLAGHEVAPFLQGIASLLSARGRFIETRDDIDGGDTDVLIIGSPLFLVRSRSSGLTKAFEAVVRDASGTGTIPLAIQKIVGMWSPSSSSGAALSDIDSTESLSEANEDEHVLFTKPANAEQLAIAKLLQRDECVLVQGPPGTGKTHTIANLIGAFLADGKTVLVVSEKIKALKVLHEKVVPELQPLCVSVLDSTEDNKMLNASIQAIALRSASVDPRLLAGEARELAATRESLLKEIRALRIAILEARTNEIRSIVVGGIGVSPIDAAKFVYEGRERDSWLPGPLKAGEAPPLSVNEILGLYASNVALTSEAERALVEVLPDLSGVPDPNEFSRLLSEDRSLDHVGLDVGQEFWAVDSGEGHTLDGILGSIDAALKLISGGELWTRRLVADGFEEDAGSRTWDVLFSEIRRAWDGEREVREQIVAFQPKLAEGFEISRAAEVYAEIANDVERSGSLPSRLQYLTRRDWKRAIEGASVENGLKPKRLQHFIALAQLARLTQLRADLVRRWNAQLVTLGAPSISDDRDAPEVLAERFRPLLEMSRAWYAETWMPCVRALVECGFQYDRYRSEIDKRYPALDEIDRIIELGKSLPALFASEYARRRRGFIARSLEKGESTMAGWSLAPAGQALRAAFHDRRREDYRKHFDAIRELSGTLGAARERLELLDRLERSAFTWASSIRNRSGAHGAGMPPGDIAAAWRWRQFVDELDRRERVSLPDLMRSLERARHDLELTTARLADSRAWLAQSGRTSEEQASALNAFVLAKRRLGKGTGKSAAVFARSARENLSKASGAVPVWIMPVVRAAEMFDPAKIKFDIVIVDEASQSDITGVLPLYLGHRVIVVGDDEQVSPSAVGMAIEPIEKLISLFLSDIPNGRLFDLKSSIYDIAAVHFRAKARLLEHFRCVPEIIRFSNELSYQGAIRPLREGSADSPTPAVVSHRVQSSEAIGQVNVDEAKTVAALVVACAEQPEYNGKTFGVISLNGEYQARTIERYLYRMFPLVEQERRRFVAGSSSQFQGDERHVMFLSVVDASRDGVHAMSQADNMRQRFNVAASRAQDQMWVVHSLDPSQDLKTGDLRRRLIEFAMDPDSLIQNEATALRRSESPFESAVLQRLSAAGYAVTAQQRVGAYRIDIVVEGATQRLAVECDGERFHQNIQQDVERQSILERLGWTFERIRGSVFYRDADRAMQPVFDRLQAMNIMPREVNLPQRPRADSELVERVRRRAVEIVASMDAPDWDRPNVERVRPTASTRAVSSRELLVATSSRRSSKDAESPSSSTPLVDASGRFFDRDLPSVARIRDLLKQLSERGLALDDDEKRYRAIRGQVVDDGQLLRRMQKRELQARIEAAASSLEA